MQFHIIDDEKYVTDLIVSMLNLLGYTSIAFNLPQHYLEFTKSDGFEMPVAVITDVDMPGMNGYEMIEMVREDYPELKFIMISGNSEVRHPAIYDACMFFSKPIRMQVLKRAASAITACHTIGPSREICADLGEMNQLPVDWKCRQCAKIFA